MVVAPRRWGEAHFFDRGEAHSELPDRVQERPLRPVEIHAADGRRLGPGGTHVRKVGAAGA